MKELIQSTRPASKYDLPQILEIVNEQIANSTANYSYEPQTLEELTHWFEDRKQNNFPVLVTEENEKITGYGSYGIFRLKIGYKHTVEHTVYIHKNHRGKGLGSILLKELINIAQQQKLHVMIGGIDAENQKSIDFHLGLGFEEVALFKEVGRKFDRWLDLVFVQLIL